MYRIEIEKWGKWITMKEQKKFIWYLNVFQSNIILRRIFYGFRIYACISTKNLNPYYEANEYTVYMTTQVLF